MNKLFTKAAKLVLGLSLAAGVGVAVGSQKANRVDAAETVYKTLSFTKSNTSSKCQNYSSSLTYTSSGFSISTQNFNNNNNGWDYIKAGGKNATQTATLKTAAAIDEAITKVVVNVSAYSTASNSSATTKLEISATSDFASSTEVTTTMASGNLTYTISSPAANMYYRVTFECDNKSGTNGMVTVTKIDFYHNDSPSSVLTGLRISSGESTVKKHYLDGQVFDPTGLTVEASWNNVWDTEHNVLNEVVWTPNPLTTGTTSVTGTYTSGGVDETVTITGLSVVSADVVLDGSTNKPSGIGSDTSTSDVGEGQIGGSGVKYGYYALATYSSNLEFNKEINNAYIGNNESFGKCIDKIRITLSSDVFSKLTLYKGESAIPGTTSVSTSDTGKTRIFDLGDDCEFFALKQTTTNTWVQVVKIEIFLGTDMSALVVDTVTINNPGTIYDGESKQLSATVTYVGTSKTNSNVTWTKVSGSSSITEGGLFTANGTTATVVRATSVLNNSSSQKVSAEYTITPVETLIKTGHKYFVVSSDNHIFLAKNLDGTYITSDSSKEKFLSTASLSANGKNVVAISGASSSLEDYAWTINETGTGTYEFLNSGDKYFNIWSTGSFYVDGSTENFEFTELNSSGYFTIKSLKTNTFLNISNNTFDTSSSTGSTGYKFIEYKTFGTLDHIEVDEENSKTVYFRNDTFNLSDVVVVAVDTNGVIQGLTGGYTCSGYNMSTIGSQTVTVTYSGKTDSYTITVNKWRSVLEVGTPEATLTFSSATGLTKDGLNAGLSGDGELALTDFSNTASYLEKPSGYSTKVLRLASGSTDGVSTFTFSSSLSITRVDVVFIGYNNDSSCALTVESGTASGSYTAANSYGSSATTTSHTFDLSTGSNNVVTFSASSSKRVCVLSAKFYATGNIDIGKTSDCLGLETFIDTYLHWEDYHNDHVTGDTTGDGSCEGYYKGENGAKAGFNALNLHQRQLFSGNSAYAAEWARLSAWATANGDTLNASSQLAQSSKISPLVNIINENTNTVAIIVVISMVSVTAIGGYFFIKKRKVN